MNMQTYAQKPVAGTLVGSWCNVRWRFNRCPGRIWYSRSTVFADGWILTFALGLRQRQYRHTRRWIDMCI